MKHFVKQIKWTKKQLNRRKCSTGKSNKSRAPSLTCPEGCGFTIAARDPHAVCPACLGWEHVQADRSYFVLSHCLAQCTVRNLGLAVVGKRGFWALFFSTIVDKFSHFINQPVNPKGLFGPAVATMQQLFKAKKREHEVNRLCLAEPPYQCNDRQLVIMFLHILAGPEEGKYILAWGV